MSPLPFLWRLLTVLFAALALQAQGFDPEKDIALKIEKGALVVSVPKGAHLKKAFMEIATPKGQPGSLKFGALPPTHGNDELGDGYWHGTFRIPLVGEGLPATAKATVTYQPCTEGEGGSCYPPTDKELTFKASEAMKAVAEPAAAGTAVPTAPEVAPAIAAAPQAATVAPAAAPQATATPAAPASRGLALSLVLVFLAGLAASLTPCVYPMIPITMAIIGAKGGGKAKGFVLSLILVLGMAVTYTTLGVVAALSGGAFGAFAQKPAFLIPVSVIFGAFALSLFGAFEIKLPDSLTMKLQGSGPRRGYLGAFIMGLVLGPLSAPCVGPVIGTVLIDIAAQGHVVLGAVKLFTFAMGMGVLFMLVGTFSAGLPKSGDWLTRFKYVMGLVVLGFAAWNVRLIVPEWANHAMWTLVMLVTAGVFGAFETAEGILGHLRKGFALIALALAVLLGLKGVESGLDLKLMPAGSAAAAAPATHGGVTWLEQDYEKALAQAKAEQKVVLVDIYAEWCAQCKELDHKTWPDPAVAAWVKQNAIAVRIDTDKVRKDLAKTLAIRSYPTVLIMDAEGREQKRLLGFLKAEDMLRELQK